MIEVICSITKEDNKTYGFHTFKDTMPQAKDLAARLKKQGYVNIELRPVVDEDSFGISEENDELLSAIYNKTKLVTAPEETESEEY